MSQEEAIAQRRAARILGVSEETVDSWLEAGVLAPARTRTSDTTRVDPKSLLQVKEKLDRLRERGLSRRAALGLMRGAPRSGGPEDRPWEKESVQLTDEYLERLRRGGLYEFRLRQDSDEIVAKFTTKTPDGERDKSKILLRVFFHPHGNHLLLLLAGYDKSRDPGDKREDKEIRLARKRLMQYRSGKAGS